MDVTIADTVGLKSAAPEVSQEAPAASEAPDQGQPEDAAPPPPAAELMPAPPPPEPAPPKPTPPKPKLEPKPLPPEPKPKPAPEKPKPVPEKPKPVPEKPKPAPAKPKPAETATKPAPETKAAAAKPSPAKKPPGLSSDFLKDLPRDPGSGKAGAGDKARGSRIGKDFLKGLAPDSPGKGAAPRAAVSAQSMAGLAGLLLSQVKPCYNPPAGGADAGAISTVLNLRMNRDGTVASATIGEQGGVNSQNAAYARQMADAARRAVLRCAPFKLPAELYEGGWDDFGFRFRP